MSIKWSKWPIHADILPSFLYIYIYIYFIFWNRKTPNERWAIHVDRLSSLNGMTPNESWAFSIKHLISSMTSCACHWPIFVACLGAMTIVNWTLLVIGQLLSYASQHWLQWTCHLVAIKLIAVSSLFFNIFFLAI